MEKSYKNYRSLALEVLRGKWMIDDDGTLLRAARDFVSRNFTEMPSIEKRSTKICGLSGDEFTSDNAVSESTPGVLIVPMYGVLSKFDNCIGCSTMEVADYLDQYKDDDRICGFILDIDSPGGSANAVMPVIAAIKRIQSTGKPIISHVDLCCSAAYWIASQTDAIFADNIMSEVGSIGVYAQIVDNRVNKQTGETRLDVYAPESSDKNAAYREALDGKVEKMEAELSELVQIFIKDVKAGRGFTDEPEGVFSGKTFLTDAAIANGMVNACLDLPGCIENVFLRFNS